MDNFYPWGFIIMFFSLLIVSITKGEKTSHQDDDIDDYWSDGQCRYIYNPQQNKTNDTDRVGFISIIFYYCNLCIVQLCDIIETTIFFKSITNKRNNKHGRRNESKSEPEKA